jgi:hypothetical protein
MACGASRSPSSEACVTNALPVAIKSLPAPQPSRVVPSPYPLPAALSRPGPSRIRPSDLGAIAPLVGGFGRQSFRAPWGNASGPLERDLQREKGKTKYRFEGCVSYKSVYSSFFFKLVEWDGLMYYLNFYKLIIRASVTNGIISLNFRNKHITRKLGASLPRQPGIFFHLIKQMVGVMELLPCH